MVHNSVKHGYRPVKSSKNCSLLLPALEPRVWISYPADDSALEDSHVIARIPIGVEPFQVSLNRMPLVDERGTSSS